MPCATWLLHVDRQAWPHWLASVPALVLRTEPELGEGFRVVTLRAPVEATQLMASGLVRWAQPVEGRTPTAALRSEESTREVAARWADLARAHSIKHFSVYIVRKHAAKAAERLANHLKATTAIVTTVAVSGAAADDLVMAIAVGDTEAVVGFTTFRRAGSPYLGGLPPVFVEDAPSRARWKLRESLDWLAVTAPDHPEPRRWLELGAYPGGMTAELAARGAHVVAVDLATGSVPSHPTVTWHRVDAATFTPDTRFDAILCDMNGTPSSAARTVARLVPSLDPDGLLVHTLKLPHWEDLPTVRAKVEGILASAGLQVIGCRHLAYNRQEVTLLARKA